MERLNNLNKTAKVLAEMVDNKKLKLNSMQKNSLCIAIEELKCPTKIIVEKPFWLKRKINIFLFKTKKLVEAWKKY